VLNALMSLARIRRCLYGLKSHARLCPMYQELDCAYAKTERSFSRTASGELIHSDENISYFPKRPSPDGRLPSVSRSPQYNFQPRSPSMTKGLTMIHHFSRICA